MTRVCVCVMRGVTFHASVKTITNSSRRSEAVHQLFKDKRRHLVVEA